MLFFLQFECSSHTSSIKSFLTEETDPDHWMCDIWTVGDGCGSNDSIPATINIYPRKPRGKKQKAEMTVMHYKAFVFRLSRTSIVMLRRPYLNLAKCIM